MRCARTTCPLCVWFAVVATLLISGCSPEPPDYPGRQMPEGLMADREQRLAGQGLFRDKCAG